MTVRWEHYLLLSSANLSNILQICSKYSILLLVCRCNLTNTISRSVFGLLYNTVCGPVLFFVQVDSKSPPTHSFAGECTCHQPRDHGSVDLDFLNIVHPSREGHIVLREMKKSRQIKKLSKWRCCNHKSLVWFKLQEYWWQW